MSRRSGTLALNCPPHQGDIVFDKGRVVAGCIHNGPQSLGESLMEAGVMPNSQYPFILLAEQEGLTLPALVQEFALPMAHFEEICEGLLKRTILAMFQWKEGTFAFESAENPDPWLHVSLDGPRHVFVRGLSPQYLALEGARLEDERNGPMQAASVVSQGTTPLAALVRPLLEDSFTDFDDAGAPPLNPCPSATPVEHLFDLREELALNLSDAQEPQGSFAAPLLRTIDGEMATLRSMLAELKEAVTRDTVVLLVLRFASLLLERAAVFIPRTGEFVGLGGFCSVNIPGNNENAETYMQRVRRLKIAQTGDTVLRQVQQSRMLMSLPLTQTEANKLLVEGLGGPWHSQRVLAAPLIAGDRVALILFGDNPSGKPLGDTDGLEIFLQQAGPAFERVAVK